MTSVKAERFTDLTLTLGESPVWNETDVYPKVWKVEKVEQLGR